MQKVSLIIFCNSCKAKPHSSKYLLIQFAAGKQINSCTSRILNKLGQQEKSTVSNKYYQGISGK